jgi:hypothetical protein
VTSEGREAGRSGSLIQDRSQGRPKDRGPPKGTRGNQAVSGMPMAGVRAGKPDRGKPIPITTCVVCGCEIYWDESLGKFLFNCDHNEEGLHVVDSD